MSKNRKLSRVKKVRVALLNSIARSLILHGKIKTTEPKAKEVRSFVEKLVTKGKSATVAARRDINVSVGKEATKKLVDELSKKYEKREGGYTRIVKAGARKSDGSKMAVIEFV
jgi:large subunit ribosomal protein L17